MQRLRQVTEALTPVDRAATKSALDPEPNSAKQPQGPAGRGVAQVSRRSINGPVGCLYDRRPAIDLAVE